MRGSSDDELIAQGYNQNSIGIIRNAKDNATVLAETMGNVTYRVAVVYYTYDSAKKITSLTTNATWEWSKKPVQNLTDIIGVGTSEHFKKDSGSTKVTYYMNGHKNSVKKVFSVKHTVTNAGRTVFSRIPMKKRITSDNGLVRDYYAMEGSCVTSWSVSGNIKTVGIATNYGHSITALEPDISVSASGVSISFTPKTTITQGDEAYISVERK